MIHGIPKVHKKNPVLYQLIRQIDQYHAELSVKFISVSLEIHRSGLHVALSIMDHF